MAVASVWTGCLPAVNYLIDSIYSFALLFALFAVSLIVSVLVIYFHALTGAATFAHGHFSFTRNSNHLVVNQPFNPFLCPFLTVNIIVYLPSNGLGTTHIEEGAEGTC